MFVIVCFICLVSLMLSLYRAIIGPNLIDRAAGMDVMTSTLAALFVIFYIFDPKHRLFVDLSFLVITVSFVATLVLSKVYQLSLRKREG